MYKILTTIVAPLDMNSKVHHLGMNLKKTILKLGEMSQIY